MVAFVALTMPVNVSFGFDQMMENVQPCYYVQKKQ